ncbi:TraR/DksA family transcriptional regulator [Actinacidiphila yeochonensis]|uniref:TraR/DksA family transcriptional regulator n=1 Tax=Actinacidiphila yeochonensis TaxID=89050 RepID=UPI00099E1441|nr:TraR/DksA C4-type zinc finger protein [Actinacidiphila yeochonensis]
MVVRRAAADEATAERTPAAATTGSPAGTGKTVGAGGTGERTAKTTKAMKATKAARKKTAVKTVAKTAAVKKTAAGKAAPAGRAEGAEGSEAGTDTEQGTAGTPAAGAVAAAAVAEKPAGKRAAARKTGARTVGAEKTAAGTAAPEPASAVPAARNGVEPETLAVLSGEDPWTAEEVEEARTILLTDVERLRVEIASSEAAVAGLLRDSGDGAGDEADTGSKNITRESELALAANTRETLEQADHALRRLDEGTYGLCEVCGKPIGKARMQAFPRATLCIDDKQKQERR